jgi:hypothetical protein
MEHTVKPIYVNLSQTSYIFNLGWSDIDKRKDNP